MKKIGIISDTHNKLPDRALEALRGCDRVIHAGDMCSPDILWQLECVAPVCAVLGNNDHADFGPSVNPSASFVEEGVRFVVVHEPRHLRGALESHAGGTSKVVAVHGHTHVPKLEAVPDSPLHDFLVCPGAVNRSRDPLGRKTVAFVQVDGGRIESIRIADLDGNTVEEVRG